MKKNITVTSRGPKIAKLWYREVLNRKNKFGEMGFYSIKEVPFINSQNLIRGIDEKKILHLEKRLDLDPIWS